MNRAGHRQIDPRKIVGYLFVAGMVLAPFLAAIYGWNVGLAVMMLALAATTYLAADALRTAGASLRDRLRLLVGINASLCVLCLVALLLRVFSD
jgi:uncharacterized membrane protein